MFLLSLWYFVWSMSVPSVSNPSICTVFALCLSICTLPLYILPLYKISFSMAYSCIFNKYACVQQIRMYSTNLGFNGSQFEAQFWWMDQWHHGNGANMVSCVNASCEKRVVLAISLSQDRPQGSKPRRIMRWLANSPAKKDKRMVSLTLHFAHSVFSDSSLSKF